MKSLAPKTPSIVTRYFLDLGFWPNRIELGERLTLSRRRWTLASYALLALGLFARQLTGFPQISLTLAKWNLSTFIASLIIALAFFPPFTIWFNKRLKHPSWPHVLWAFSYGFFSDLTIREITRLF